MKAAVLNYDKQFLQREIKWSEFSIISKLYYLFNNQKELLHSKDDIDSENNNNNNNNNTVLQDNHTNQIKINEKCKGINMF